MNNTVFAPGRRAAVIFVVVASTFLSAQTKRPLTHRDYDAWRSITSQQLSRDGKFLAYGLFPQDGDGEVVVRNLQTGAEWRQPAGARPEPGRPDPLAGLVTEEGPPPQRNVTIEFSPDGRTVVFSTFPTKDEVAKAKKEKRKPEDMPKAGIVVMGVNSGAVARIANVKSFQVAETAGNV